MVSMNKLSRETRVQIVRALVEGNSIRATCRMTGQRRATVLKTAHGHRPGVRGWEDDPTSTSKPRRFSVTKSGSSFSRRKMNVPQDMMGDMVGDVWTWTAIDADTKLVINWTIGLRDADTALDFMDGVAKRLKNRVQLTTDGHHSYLSAVALAFENNIDYAQLVKQYGGGGGNTPETRYSPGVCTGATKEPRLGSPNPKQSLRPKSRQNLTMQ